MEITMPSKYFSNTQSRFSSLLRIRHNLSTAKLPQKPTISKPVRTVVSSPPRRLTPDPLPFDLRKRAISTITTLRNQEDPSHASRYISENVRMQRDEDEETIVSRDEFVSAWETDSTGSWDSFEMEVLEAAVDEIQRKVWIRSELRDLDAGVRKESVDMVTFDSDGLLTACVGSQRIVSRRQSWDLD